MRIVARLRIYVFPKLMRGCVLHRFLFDGFAIDSGPMTWSQIVRVSFKSRNDMKFQQKKMMPQVYRKNLLQALMSNFRGGAPCTIWLKAFHLELSVQLRV